MKHLVNMNLYTIIIQVKLSDNFLGTENELELRNSLEEHFDGIFSDMENGSCDGGQIGAGTMEIFIEEIIDIDLALEAVKNEMKALKIDRDYKIVWRPCKNGEDFKVDFATNKDSLFSFAFFDFN